MIGKDEYKTIIGEVTEGVYTEKRSKFYAFAHHVCDEEQVRNILKFYRKKYYDARHICYAYVLGYDKSYFRANDDGEPNSTAGKPILGQIVKNDLTNVLVVVIRYYGGINLGTGGLIVAYRTAAAASLSSAKTEIRQVEGTVNFSYPYEFTNDVMKVIKELSPKILSQDYENNTCNIILSIRKSNLDLLINKLNNIKLQKGF